jgi:hypothetical protein
MLYLTSRMKKTPVSGLSRLTETHLYPNSFEKMKVKYAVQILSKSVANGFRYFRSMPETQHSFQGSMSFTYTSFLAVVFITSISN